MSGHYFVDPGVDSGPHFTTFFLQSPEVKVDLLKRFIPSGSNRQKNLLAGELAFHIDQDERMAQEVLTAYACQPRTWLSMKFGKIEALPTAKPAISLLREFGDEAWYGPISPQHGLSKIYLRSFHIPHYIQIGDATLRRTRIRWILAAEIYDNLISFSWNGFSRRTAEDNPSVSQFRFWEKVPSAYEELEDMVGGPWVHPTLHRLILKDLWDDCIADETRNWQHLRIRAESSGVAVNARSSGVAEVDIRGLKALTGELATAAIKALDISPTYEQAISVENAIIRILIHEWGTKSYEFSLNRTFSNDEPSEPSIFRAHCYFGHDDRLQSQDSLQHVKCFAGCGGSRDAQRFILELVRKYGL